LPGVSSSSDPVLVARDVPDPEVGAGMLGVAVPAAGSNFFDILMAPGQ